MILGIDFGTKHLGFALSDELESIAEPWAHFEAKNLTVAVRTVIKQLKLVKKIYKNKEFKVLVGVPGGLYATPTVSFSLAQEFANLLTQQITESVILWDETYSTHIAQRSKFLQGNEHAKAATVILQSYLDNEATKTSKQIQN